MPVPWNSGSYYKYNATTPLLSDVVQVGNVSYIATANSFNQQPPNASFWAITTSTSLTANNLIVNGTLTAGGLRANAFSAGTGGAFTISNAGAVVNSFIMTTGTLKILTRGTFTANGTTAVVVSVAAGILTIYSVILITTKTSPNTNVLPYVISVNVAGNSFSVVAADGNTSIYNWTIIN